MHQELSLPTSAVVYLSRGADPWWEEAGQNFLKSYQRHPSGAPEKRYVILKGFPDVASERRQTELFANQGFTALALPDAGYDIGAYKAAAIGLSERYICFFNTRSEILSDLWLAKLIVHMHSSNISLVGATGSFESLRTLSSHFPKFPNAHVRSNAMAIERTLFCELTEGLTFNLKYDAFKFESGRNSLTRKILSRGGKVAIVGRDGRAYAPEWWPSSRIYRRGMQENLLVGDNVTRLYDNAVWTEKRRMVISTWGNFIREDVDQFSP